jgi:hypothetical protein
LHDEARAATQARRSAYQADAYGLDATFDSDQAESGDSTRCKSDIGVGL